MEGQLDHNSTKDSVVWNTNKHRELVSKTAGVLGHQSHFWQRSHIHIPSSVAIGHLGLALGRGLSPTCVQMATIFCHHWDQYFCPWSETSALSRDPSYMLFWESLVQLHVAKAVFCCLVHCE